MTKKSSAARYTLNENEIRKIIDSTNTRLERIIVKLFVYTGAHRYELSLLRFQDIKLGTLPDFGIVVMPTAKQEKLSKAGRDKVAYENAREIPILNKDLFDTLSDYIDILKVNRRITPSSRLLQTRESESITVTRLNQIVADVANRAGVKPSNPKRKNVHPHLFRHSFVRYARKNGLHDVIIKEILGHSKIETTYNLYGRPSIQDMKDELHTKMRGFAGC